MDEQFKRLQEQLDSLPKEQASSAAPTSREIGNQQSGLSIAGNIDALRSKARAEDWYPQADPEDKQTGGESVPFLNKIIDTSLTPLYGIVGGVDYLTGQSKKDSFGEAVNYNANEAKRTFGDVTGSGAVGLAADIVFDPVNWLTAGTTALIPRIAAGTYKGAAKGGVKGAAKGAGAAAESRILESVLMTRGLAKGAVKLGSTGASFMNPVRYINKAKGATPTKTAMKESQDNAGAITKWVEARSQKAITNFDEVMGQTALQRIVADRAPVGLLWRKGVQDLAGRAMQKSPILVDYFDKYFKYSNSDWTRISQLRDALIKTSGKELDSGVKAYIKSFETGEDFEMALAKINTQMKEVANKELTSLPENFMEGAEDLKKGASVAEMQKVTSKLAAEAPAEKVATFQKLVDDANEAKKVSDDPGSYITSDPVENGLRLAAEKELIDLNNTSGVWDDLQEIIKRGDMGETGVKWWDNTRQTMRSWELQVKKANEKKGEAPLNVRVGAKAAKVLDVYEALIATFKRAAVGASPTAWTNAIFGNLVMAKMAGMDIMDPAYFSALKKADTIIASKSGSELLLAELFDVSDILPILRNNPSLFESTTGLKGAQIEKLVQARQLVEKTRKTGIDAGVLPKNIRREEVVAMLDDTTEDAAKEIRRIMEQQNEEIAIAAEASARNASQNAYKNLLDSVDEDGRVGIINTTDFASNELFNSTVANKWFSSLSKKAEQPGNYGAKLGNAIFNGMPDAYGALDYRYKLGSIFYASVEGVKESELQIISRLVDFDPEGVTKINVGGVDRFRLSTSNAMELANEAFLNYNAMPAIVKVLRNLPLVGAPFAAFTYGMYTKTARTALTNPAVFNKVNLAMDEFEKDTTPIEKGLLSMDRYSYLDDPAMINIGGMQNNMVMLNLANMIPYYSLNMFQPPQRKYEGTLPNTMIQTLDRLPIMQDPTGNVIFDYFLLPHLIGEELPQGAFGQTLYPKDAGFLEKSKYAARSLVDPYVPGIVQPFAGLAVGIAENAGIVPEGTTQFAPGYRLRSTGEGVQGNTSVGVGSKEPAFQRTGRNIGSSVGLSFQSPVPYSYLDLQEVIRNNNSKQ